MPVKESDVLTIPEEAKWVPTPVAWKQSFKEFNKNSCVSSSQTLVEPEKTNYLLVSEEMLESFKWSKIEKTETGYKLTVDEDYLFGQQRGDKNRLLVYHDKQRVIFQHRFVKVTLVTFSSQATEVSNKLVYGQVKMMSVIMSAQIGNKLHPMSDASK